MILIFGGTTEGRRAVEVAEAAGHPYYYSTKGEGQQVAMTHGRRLAGILTAERMEALCRDEGIRLVIDAAHPFATQLHATIAAVSASVGIPVVRLERRFPPRDPRLVWCQDYADACRRIREEGVRSLLALSGVQTIAALRSCWTSPAIACWFRILRREESLEKVRAAGFPEDRIVYYEETNSLANITRETGAHFDAIITKESGESGGFREKVDEALALGWKVFVVERPALPTTFHTVTGEHGLRKAIEQYAPGFFELRTGFTTGACATAAAKAALLTLLTGDTPEEVPFTIPNGEVLTLPVESVTAGEDWAEATVVKHAGDDPDVTDGCKVVVKVAYPSNQTGVGTQDLASGSTQKPDPDCSIRFHRGEGVGILTVPGFDYPVGDPAINKGPRPMITRELTALYAGPLDVTVSVPGGEELAQRTFNPRLGIEGGISILGTSGIVSPFSHEAFVQAIRRELEIAKAVEKSKALPTAVISSGGKSERYVRSLYPTLPPQAFVHYGNAIGDTLEQARDLDITRVAMGIMTGKAVKMAEGHLNTHSHTVTMNKAFLIQVVEEATEDAALREQSRAAIHRITLARELWDELPQAVVDAFFRRIVERCQEVGSRVLKGTEDVLAGAENEFTVHLIKENGEIFES